MVRKLNLIVNPQAAQGHALEVQGQVERFFQEQGIIMQVHHTRFPRHALELAQQLTSAGEREIISLGGDGTGFEVINGVMRSGRAADVTVGLIPLGTGNAFLKDFGYERWQDTARCIVEASTRTVDLGKVLDLDRPDDPPLYFHNLLGFGIFADGSRIRHQYYNPLGRVAYLAAFFHLLLTLKHYPITIRFDQGGQKSFHSPLLAVCNSQFTGHRMHICPPARVDDGHLDLLYSDDLSRLELLTLFSRLSSGRHLHSEKTHYTPIRWLEIRIEDISLSMIDGEQFPSTHVRVEVAPAALRLFL